MSYAPFNTHRILRSVRGNNGKLCVLMEPCEFGGDPYWWVVVIGGTVAEGCIPEADLSPEPVRTAA